MTDSNPTVSDLNVAMNKLAEFRFGYLRACVTCVIMELLAWVFVVVVKVIFGETAALNGRGRRELQNHDL